MLTPHFRLEGERLYLRPITIDDVNETYVEWLNDPEVNQFLENRFEVHTLASARAYLQKISQNSTNVFLVMVRKDTEAHIGNIKLGPIDLHHQYGSIGLLIGDKNSWGKGVATEAVQLLTQYAFDTLNLHKLA
mgnify:CR=1 FL=1